MNHFNFKIREAYNAHFKKVVVHFLAFCILLTPFIISAEGLVPECNTGAINTTTGQYDNPCNFDKVMDFINGTINFLLFYFATPLAAMAICYAGFQLLFSGGSSEKITKAKKIIKNVVIGYILALGAWLIVKTIFTTLGFTGETFLR